MQKRIFVFKALPAAGCILLAACMGVNLEQPSVVCTFTAIDVGEGLSQMSVVGAHAVVWDVGDTFASRQWLNGYERLGSPHICAMVVSHTHQDHMGGLSAFSEALNFSGIIVTHPFEDTAYIRRIAAAWRKDIRFRTIAQGDTLGGLDGTYIECLWPPRTLNVDMPLSDSLKNRFSLCFALHYRHSSIMITSDIDTIAQRRLSAAYGFGLASDILMVPHHGSAAAVDEVFYGYVNPSIAIISCGVNNSYGFPTQKVMDMLYQMKVRYYITASSGAVTAISNGHYWTFK